jgi:hypothetical protein
MLKIWKYHFVATVVLVFVALVHGNNEIIDLGTLPNYPRSVSASINNTGQAVGYADMQNGINFRACLFDTSGSGKNLHLGGLGVFIRSIASAVNDNGMIVGMSTHNSDDQACIFDSTGSGNNQHLGSLGGGPISAFSVNNNGMIVGWASGAASVMACLLMLPERETIKDWERSVGMKAQRHILTIIT